MRVSVSSVSSSQSSSVADMKPNAGVAPTAAAAGSSLTPLELERRERNRSKVRRSYYRKIYNINELRAQVDVLEDEYERILQEQEQFAALHADAMATEAQALAPTPSRQQLLRQLAQVRKNLYKENEDLRNLQMEHDKAHGSLQHLVDEQLEGSARKLMASNSERNFGPACEVALLRRFTIEECLAVIRDAYARITAYIDSQRLKAPATTVLGWTDRRCIADSVLSFCFQKTFASRSFETIGGATWELLTQPSDIVQLFSPYLNVRYSVVQRLDANNVIVYRTIEQTDLDVVQKSLLLMTRFQVERGEIVLTRGLDPNRVADNALDLSRIGKREVWQDDFTWVLVENPEGSSGDCAVSFGGEVETEDPCNLFWLIEVLLIVLRWETRVVGPLFELQ